MVGRQKRIGAVDDTARIVMPGWEVERCPGKVVHSWKVVLGTAARTADMIHTRLRIILFYFFLLRHSFRFVYTFALYFLPKRIQAGRIVRSLNNIMLNIRAGAAVRQTRLHVCEHVMSGEATR